jgi:hypothetical protein
MTGDQILIFGLLAAAFAAGWAARGAGPKRGRDESRHDQDELLTRSLRAVGRALVASHVAVGTWSERGAQPDASARAVLEVVARELTELARFETEVTRELGHEHRLRVELGRVAQSLSLLGSDLGASIARNRAPVVHRTSDVGRATRFSPWQPTAGRRGVLRPARHPHPPLAPTRNRRRPAHSL